MSVSISQHLHAEGRFYRTPESDKLDLGPPLQDNAFPLEGEDGSGDPPDEGGSAQLM